MIQKEMLEYQDLDLELEKIKNTVGKSPDNVIRVRAGKQLAACKAKINEIMPKYKNLRAQLDNARKKLEAICDQVDKVGQELENVEMDEQAVYMLKKLTAQKNELAAVEKDIKDKMLEVVEELDQDLKEVNYHYLEDYQKEDSTTIILEQFMLQLI